MLIMIRKTNSKVIARVTHNLLMTTRQKKCCEGEGWKMTTFNIKYIIKGSSKQKELTIYIYIYLFVFVVVRDTSV